MGWLDLIEVGSAIADAGSVIRINRQFKKQYPDVYPVFDQMSTACLESDFDFRLAREGPFYFSTMLVRGLLSSAKMKSLAYVQPDPPRLMNVVTMLEEALFVRSEERVRRLLNWVNSQLFCGKFFVFTLAKSAARSDLLMLGYQAAVPYAGVPASQIKRLALNMFLELAAFHDFFSATVLQASEGKLDFDADGNPQGAPAAQLGNLYTRARQRLGKGVGQYTGSQLGADLQRQLSANGIAGAAAPGTSALALRQLDAANDQAWHWAYVTDMGQVVFEAHSRWTVRPDRRRAILGSRYLLYLNCGRVHAGTYSLDLARNRLVCRIGFNAQRLENQLPAALVGYLAHTLAAMARRIRDLRDMAMPSANAAGPSMGSAPPTAPGFDALSGGVLRTMQLAGDPDTAAYQEQLVAFNNELGPWLPDLGM